jgi:peptidyl-prolyl cis-trans isomerase C
VGRLAAALLAVVGLPMLATAQQVGDAASEAAKPAATVDGEVITFGEVDKVVKSQAAWQLFCRLPKSDPTLINDFRWNEIEELVRQRLLQREVRSSAVATEARLDEMVQEKILEMGGQQKLQALAGLLRTDEASFVRQLREQIAIAAYALKKITPGITITEEEVAAAVEKYPEVYAIKPAVHVRHILVRMDPVREGVQDPPEARQRIEAIRQRVLAPGADFLAIAREVSECPSAPNGGDLGFIEAGTMGGAFDQAMVALQPGEISEPVRTGSGYHIVRLEARRALTAEAVHENARQMMLQNQVALRLQQRVDELRRTAKVEILLPPRRVWKKPEGK